MTITLGIDTAEVIKVAAEHEDRDGRHGAHLARSGAQRRSS
jgi:hypothetical protein